MVMGTEFLDSFLGAVAANRSLQSAGLKGGTCPHRRTSSRSCEGSLVGAAGIGGQADEPAAILTLAEEQREGDAPSSGLQSPQWHSAL